MIDLQHYDVAQIQRMGCERLVLLFSHLVELKAVGICKNRNCSNSNNQLSRNSVNLLKKLKKNKIREAGVRLLGNMMRRDNKYNGKKINLFILILFSIIKNNKKSI